ncbi:hypothetical protein [Hydrogenimonas sp.]
MKRSFPLFAAGLSLLLTGCAPKYYEKPQPALIVLKSPALKYADMGFLYRGKQRIKVQIYSAGRPVFTLSIGKRVCVDSKCMSEKEFYRKYMHADYPPGTLASIFSKRPIFGGEGVEREGQKQQQRIEEAGRFDIIYTFDTTSARFRDRLNHILIKITER